MEGCSNASAGAASSLPDDPLVEILSRVPAKSVCRFKCVSKAWRDLIADPDNRKKLRQPMQGLFVQMSEVHDGSDDGSDYVELDGDEPDRISINFIDLTPTVRSVHLDIDPCFSFLTEMTGFKTLLDSCNGLILFGQNQGYIVCNPTTRQWSAVPDCGSPEALSHTYLAFDPAVSSHFHLVHFHMSDVDLPVESLHVYSSETGTWGQNQIDKQKEQGELEGWHHQFTSDFLDNQCAFVNGLLHMMVWNWVSNRQQSQHILAVDVQGKARKLINVPAIADGRHGCDSVCYLGQSQGHLHCVTQDSVHGKNRKMSTWVLQDYNAQEWVLKNIVSTFDVLGKIGAWPEFQVIDIHQDYNLICFFHYMKYELIAYNMDSKEVSVIGSLEDDKVQPEFARCIPYFTESPVLSNKY